MSLKTKNNVCVIGGGPAGLRAAETAASHGAGVSLFEAMPSVGRKFLVAGKGGLNISNTDPAIAGRYLSPGAPPGIWDSLLAEFSPSALRAWVEELGVSTFTVSSGRIYPREMKSAPLLRRWVARLRGLGVRIFVRHRWTSIEPAEGPRWRLGFQSADRPVCHEADAVVFALGGGSWPSTGSDGSWQEPFRRLGVGVRPIAPANCGWETVWPPSVLESEERLPLKNVRARAGDHWQAGELLLTRYGLEGGIIYALTPALRTDPVLHLDLKPSLTSAQLIERLSHTKNFHLHEAFERCRLQPSARVLLRSREGVLTSRESFVAGVKEFSITLTRPRPLAEAISSAGGITWEDLDERLMLRHLPGVFVAGEMADWEAPTGGYLLQGCLSTGTRAGRQAALWPAAGSTARPPR